MRGLDIVMQISLMKKKKFNNDILDELKKLPPKMINNDGNIVFFGCAVRKNESREEHISKIHHNLKKKDIKRIPEILKNPLKVVDDPKRKNNKNYYAYAFDANVPTCFIKIVTSKNYDKSEKILTIFRTNNFN